MNKKIELNKIAKSITACKICHKGKKRKMVFGEGDPDSKIVFVGEAPGKEEAKQGRPFVGRSGKLLRSFIKEIGLTEEEVYITSPVKYLPKKGTPSKSEIIHGSSHLEKQLAVINPKIIVLLGKTAVQAVFKRDVSIMKEHGKIISKNGKRYLITFHPAAAVRFAKNRPFFEKDFQKLKTLISKII